MKAPPLISAIVLNWNGKEYLHPCLRSLETQTYPSLEIIVVDNASTDGSVDWIRSHFPDLRLIVNRDNLGYGGGNNRGIREAGGSFILLVNNDAEMETNCIELLWKGMDADPRIGATTPKILLHDRRDRMDAAGLIIYPDGLAIGRGHLEPQEKYSRREEVFSGSGCASLFRREMLEEIGLLDEDFFAYAEDTDLGWRARLAGWKAFYVPEAIVYHLHSRKFGSYSPLKAFLVERNRIWVAWKNFPLRLIALGPFYTLGRYFFQGIGALTRRGASAKFGKGENPLLLLLILLKAFLSAIQGLPVMLRKRREIQRKKKISADECFRLCKKYGIKAKEIAFKD